MDVGELRTLIEQQIALMIAVATGGPRIDDKQEEYIERRRAIRDRLNDAGVADPNPHADLWHWYAEWSGNLPTYADRRRYVRDLYQPLLDSLDSAAARAEAASRDPMSHSPEEARDHPSESGAVRLHEGTLDALPAVAIPDWELLTKLDDVIRGAWPGALISFVAKDRGGQYRAPTVESLQEAVEAAEEDPYELQILADRDTGEYCVVRMQNHRPSWAEIVSTSLMVVHHFTARVDELFRKHRQQPPTYEELQQQAAYEQMLRDEEGPRYVNVVTDVQPVPKWYRTRVWFRRHGARIEKWALVLLPVVLGVLLTAWLIGK